MVITDNSTKKEALLTSIAEFQLDFLFFRRFYMISTGLLLYTSALWAKKRLRKCHVCARAL